MTDKGACFQAEKIPRTHKSGNQKLCNSCWKVSSQGRVNGDGLGRVVCLGLSATHEGNYDKSIELVSLIRKLQSIHVE